MSDNKLPEFCSFSAGATRTKLKVFAQAERQGYGTECVLYAKRHRVGKHEGRNSMFVFVNETCPPEEAEVVVMLMKGYAFSKHGKVDPIVCATSDATCSSGVLMVVPFGFEYKVNGYKNRTPPNYYRVERGGTKKITSEVAAANQQPV